MVSLNPRNLAKILILLLLCTLQACCGTFQNTEDLHRRHNKLQHNVKKLQQKHLEQLPFHPLASFPFDARKNSFPDKVAIGTTVNASSQTAGRYMRQVSSPGVGKKRKYKLGQGGFSRGRNSSGLAIAGTISIVSSGNAGAVAAANAMDANHNERSRADAVSMVWHGGSGSLTASSSDSKDFHLEKTLCVKPPCKANDAYAISYAQIIKIPVFMPGKHGNCTLDSPHEHNASELDDDELARYFTTTPVPIFKLQKETEKVLSPNATGRAIMEAKTEEVRKYIKTSTEKSIKNVRTSTKRSKLSRDQEDCQENVQDDFQATDPNRRCRKNRKNKKTGDKNETKTTSSKPAPTVFTSTTGSPIPEAEVKEDEICETVMTQGDQSQDPVPVRRCVKVKPVSQVQTAGRSALKNEETTAAPLATSEVDGEEICETIMVGRDHHQDPIPVRRCIKRKTVSQAEASGRSALKNDETTAAPVLEAAKNEETTAAPIAQAEVEGEEICEIIMVELHHHQDPVPVRRCVKRKSIPQVQETGRSALKKEETTSVPVPEAYVEGEEMCEIIMVERHHYQDPVPVRRCIKRKRVSQVDTSGRSALKNEETTATSVAEADVEGEEICEVIMVERYHHQDPVPVRRCIKIKRVPKARKYEVPVLKKEETTAAPFAAPLTAEVEIEGDEICETILRERDQELDPVPVRRCIKMKPGSKVRIVEKSELSIDEKASPSTSAPQKQEELVTDSEICETILVERNQHHGPVPIRRCVQLSSQSGKRGRSALNKGSTAAAPSHQPTSSR